MSYETDRNHDLAPRQIARYRTENGEEFEVPFADDAEIPGTWLCRNGMEGTLIEGGDLAEPKKSRCRALNRSTVRNYVPLLVERRAREVLARSAAARAAIAEVPTPAVAGSETVAVVGSHKRQEWPSATWAWLSTRFAPNPIGSERA